MVEIASRHGTGRWALLASAALILVACGGDGAGDSPSTEAPAEGVDSAVVAGDGGGTLVFDDEEIPLRIGICSFRGEMIEVGTLSDPGHRVFISTNSSSNPISAQILDPDGVQWFPQNVSGDEAQRDGNTFTSDPTPYFNNNDDRIVEVSFTVECP